MNESEEENYCVQPEKCMEIPICRLRYIRDFEIYMGIYMNQRNNHPGSTPFDRMCIVSGICADGLFSFRDCSGRQ